MKNWTPQDEALLKLLQEKKQRAEALEFKKSVARKLRTIADGIDAGEIDFHDILEKYVKERLLWQ